MHEDGENQDCYHIRWLGSREPKTRSPCNINNNNLINSRSRSRSRSRFRSRSRSLVSISLPFCHARNVGLFYNLHLPSAPAAVVKARFLAAEIQRLFALGQLRKVLACALVLCRTEAKNKGSMQGTQRGIVKGEIKRKAVLTVGQGQEAANNRQVFKVASTP